VDVGPLTARHVALLVRLAVWALLAAFMSAVMWGPSSCRRLIDAPLGETPVLLWCGPDARPTPDDALR